MTVAILGGVFDPPHLGHVALAEGARDQLGADRLLVLVAERPGHKGVVADAETRRRLAELALGRFGDVRLDDHPYTVDFLRAAGLDRVRGHSRGHLHDLGRFLAHHARARGARGPR